MSRVQLTCPDCGDTAVRAGPDIFALRFVGSDHGSYTFRCPRCARWCVKKASFEVLRQLENAEVTVRAWSPPRPDPAEGPAICHDDLIDFHNAIQGL